MHFKGYRRKNGDVGIRNKTLIISVDECCEGIARSISNEVDNSIVLTNWYTCMLGGNEETYNQLVEVGKHPNIAGVLILAMGCGSIPIEDLKNEIAKSKKPIETLNIQKVGGTKKTIEVGIEKLSKITEEIKDIKREEIPISELVIGVKCGGSDTSSGIASNPSVGNSVDKLIDLGATCIGGELFELQGCQRKLDSRAVSEKVSKKIETLIDNERKRWSVDGVNLETMSIGNYVGGLTTIEEKSLGALHKTGEKPIVDILQINKDFIEKPEKPGFYLSEATMLCGGSGVNFASLGAHLILWTTGSAGFNDSIIPVIRVSGNEAVFNEDIDIDARGVMDGRETIDSVGDRIVDLVQKIASGKKTNIEDIGYSTLTLYQKDQRVEKNLNISCKRY